MSLMVKDKQLFKNYNKIWKKNWRINGYIDFESKATYGDDDKYINTKIKTYKVSITTYIYDKTGFKHIMFNQ